MREDGELGPIDAVGGGGQGQGAAGGAAGIVRQYDRPGVHSVHHADLH